MTVKAMDERPIKEVVARRAEELGSRVSPRDISLRFKEADAAPGWKVFHASWGAGQSQGWLSGLVGDDEAPDTYAAQALEKIFRRWIEAEGKLRDPSFAATVAAYLYDAAERHEVILTEEDKVNLIDRQDWLNRVRPPESIEVAGQPGITFWWVGDSGPSQMRVYLDERGRIRTEETFIQDFIVEEGLDS